MNGRELFGLLYLRVLCFHVGMRVYLLSAIPSLLPVIFANVESEGTMGLSCIFFARLLETAASVLLNCAKALPNLRCKVI